MLLPAEQLLAIIFTFFTLNVTGEELLDEDPAPLAELGLVLELPLGLEDAELEPPLGLVEELALEPPSCEPVTRI